MLSCAGRRARTTGATGIMSFERHAQPLVTTACFSGWCCAKEFETSECFCVTVTRRLPPLALDADRDVLCIYIYMCIYIYTYTCVECRNMCYKGARAHVHRRKLEFTCEMGRQKVLVSTLLRSSALTLSINAWTSKHAHINAHIHAYILTYINHACIHTYIYTYILT